MTLMLRGARVEARSDLPLQEGDRLQLRVRELDGTRLILQVVDAVTDKAVPAPASTKESAVPLPLLAAVVPLLAGGQPAEALVRVEAEAPERRGSRTGHGAPLQVVVHWEGPSLGPVQARFTAIAVPGPEDALGLSVRLMVSTPEARALVLEHAADLQQSLAALGWPDTDVGCQVTLAALLRAERQAGLPLGLARLDLRG